MTERRRPITDYQWLTVNRVEPFTPDRTDYYRQDLELTFTGRGSLP